MPHPIDAVDQRCNLRGMKEPAELRPTEVGMLMVTDQHRVDPLTDLAQTLDIAIDVCPDAVGEITKLDDPPPIDAILLMIEDTGLFQESLQGLVVTMDVRDDECLSHVVGSSSSE